MLKEEQKSDGKGKEKKSLGNKKEVEDDDNDDNDDVIDVDTDKDGDVVNPKKKDNNVRLVIQITNILSEVDISILSTVFIFF